MRSILKWTTAGSWLSLVGLWLLYVAQRPAPVLLSRSFALLALVATLGLLAHCAVTVWRRGERARIAALIILVVLALGIYLPGLGHEISGSYYADEGTYRSHAHAINEGRVLIYAFHYPHLLYYVDAFATWVASLFHPAILSWSDSLYGVSDWTLFCLLLARILTALAGAMTVVPVFFLAERLAGLGAGVFASVLIISATHYHEGANFHTCDIPSAFFAMGCLAYVGRLLHRERLRDYLLAGIWAGLAAGAKYPAGVVAVAIIAVYLRGRIRERRWGWGLPLAGMSALLTFLLTTPSLVISPKVSIFGGQGALFGWRQYTRGKWIGVVQDSNLVYYLDLIVASFGWLAIALGVVGLAFLGKRVRADVTWLLPFPLVFLGLMVAMSIAVERNLYPALPAVATLLGVGIWTLGRRIAQRLSRHARAWRWAVAAMVAASVALPLWRVTCREIAFCRESTREIAGAWVYHNLPHGSRIRKERYTPNIYRRAFQVEATRWIGTSSIEELRDKGIDYVILANTAYQRFLDPEHHFEKYQTVVEQNYRAIFERLELVKSFEPGLIRRGPTVKIYQVGSGPQVVGE